MNEHNPKTNLGPGVEADRNELKRLLEQFLISGAGQVKIAVIEGCLRPVEESG